MPGIVQSLDIIAKGVLNGYQPARIDNAGDPSYFGFLNKQGYYYIMKLDNAGGAITYFTQGIKAIGKPKLDVDWGNRVALTYVEYNEAPFVISQ